MRLQDEEEREGKTIFVWELSSILNEMKCVKVERWNDIRSQYGHRLKHIESTDTFPKKEKPYTQKGHTG